MILTCQKCSTSFNLDETLLKASGSKVRCSLCQNIWVAFPPETPAKGRLEPDDDGMGAGAAGLAATGAVLGGVAAGLTENDAQETEHPEAAAPELKFFADEEIGEAPFEDDDLVTDEINLDELDQLLSEDESSAGRPSPEEDFKTEELNLADLEKMLAAEGESPGAEKDREAADSEELDFGEALPDNAASGEIEKEDSVIEELDLDLEDLEHLLEEDTGLGDEIAAVEESFGGITPEAGAQERATPAADEINLDLDSDLEDLLEDDPREPAIEETEEIKVSEIGGAPEDAEGPAAGDAGDNQELDFELAPGLDGIFDEDEAKDMPLEETEELDFSEFEADFASSGDEPAEEDQELELDLDIAAPEGQNDEPDDLGDLALSLEEDAATEPPSDEEALPELDFSDLSQALDESPAKAADAVEEAEAPELKLEMDFGDAGKDEADELDLFLEDDALADGAEQSRLTEDIAEETRELEVDELESLLEGMEDSSGAENEPSSDRLELDIDLDSLDEDGDDDMDDATRELDLNDIEKILEMEGAGEDTAEEASPSEDLDLDLDMGSVTPPAEKDEETGEETTDADAALDLSELEKMLDVEDTTDSPAAADDDMDDLDLDFELQPSTEEGDDLDLEFDMLDEEPAQASALFDTSESEDLGLDLADNGGGGADDRDIEGDLDFEIMDDDLAVEEVDLDLDAEDISADTLSEPIAVAASRPGRPHDRDLTQELMDEMAAADTQTMAAPPMETKPIKPAAPMKRKKKSSKSLVLLFILVLLGGAGYLLPKYTGIKLPEIKMPDLSGIPFIGQYLGSSSNQAILPVESSLKGEWVQNQQAGRLYIIQGRVKNDYKSPRSYIRVTGRVYANGRKFQRAAKAYCGNIVPTDELATLSLADIQQKLNNRMGLDNTNVNVAPGQEVPFMVVFGDLPPDVELQEFAVEISGSLPVTAK